MRNNYPALVLNADYAPVSFFPLSVWSFERTLRNVLKGRVTVVETYDTVLRSPTFEYVPPSVVSLNTYVKRPNKVRFTRMNVFLRDKFTCQYCGNEKKVSQLTFDHVVPRSHGGKTSWENIVSCCAKCNTLKADRRDMKPKTKPKQPQVLNMKSLRNKYSTSEFNQTWVDYLYWESELEEDK